MNQKRKLKAQTRNARQARQARQARRVVNGIFIGLIVLMVVILIAYYLWQGV